jgi:hypothetical protein
MSACVAKAILKYQSFVIKFGSLQTNLPLYGDKFLIDIT